MFADPSFAPGVLVAAGLAMFAGALVQGSLGLGAGLVVVPVLGLAAPERLPQVLILTTLPLAVAMAVRERAALRPRAVAWLTFGAVPGAVAGLGLVLWVPGPALGVLFGAVTLVGSLAGLSRLGVVPSDRARLLAGLAAGVMGSSAGLAGPPLALLHARSERDELRATLAVVFVVVSLETLAGLAAVGRLAPVDLGLSVLLLGPMAAGFVASQRLDRGLSALAVRRGVLLAAAAAGLVLLVQASAKLA
ncbi:MAG: sulfite exporter TauE/SafE family protein [Chloroflexota bacterium]